MTERPGLDRGRAPRRRAERKDAAIVVLASPDDIGALRVVQVLRTRGGPPVLLVSVAQLLLAPEWRHDPLGESRVVLGNGTILDDTVGAVLNRVGHVDPPQFVRARARDRTYAQAEFFSLILSWLAGFGGRVVNAPHPGNLMGARGSAVEDRILALELGLPPAPATIATSARCLSGGEGVVSPLRGGDPGRELAPDSVAAVPPVLLGRSPAVRLADPGRVRRREVTVVGDHVVEAGLPDAVATGALLLARHRSLDLAGVEVISFDDGRHGFGAISPCPALTAVGTAEAVADLLSDRAERRAA